MFQAAFRSVQWHLLSVWNSFIINSLHENVVIFSSLPSNTCSNSPVCCPIRQWRPLPTTLHCMSVCTHVSIMNLSLLLQWGFRISITKMSYLVMLLSLLTPLASILANRSWLFGRLINVECQFLSQLNQKKKSNLCVFWISSCLWMYFLWHGGQCCLRKSE